MARRQLSRGAWRTIFTVTLAYLAVSTLWILTSDRFLQEAVTDPDLRAFYQSVKGLAFVLFTAVLIFSLLRYLLGRLQHDQQMADRKLHVSEERYRALSLLIQSYGFSFVLMKDGTTNADWITDSAELIYGYTPRELCEMQEGALVLPEDRPVYDAYRKQLRGFQAVTTEYRVVRRDGSVCWLRVQADPMPITDGVGLARVIGAAQDVTAQKEVENELIRARLQAEELNRLKDSFLANMSHEIRTPLTSIIGFADVLVEETTGIAQEFADIIRKGGARLMDTLNSVLDLAQLRGRSLSLSIEPIDVVSEAYLAVAFFQPAAQEHGIALTLDVPEQPLYACVDRGAFGRILNNLISNAIKFTTKGSVTVSIGRDQNLVVFDVIDTGVGISPEFIPQLFQEFSQESTGYNREFEGSGLGLSITRQLVELMKGSIAIRSEKGRGTTVTFTLPLAGDYLNRSLKSSAHSP